MDTLTKADLLHEDVLLCLAFAELALVLPLAQLEANRGDLKNTESGFLTRRILKYT